jgi:hypothetical protein
VGGPGRHRIDLVRSPRIAIARRGAAWDPAAGARRPRRHPAFDKAAHYFGVRLVKVPVGSDLRADARAMARAIGRRTIGLVASAPQYPHGVVDPIGELGVLAQDRRLPLHVDACVGGSSCRGSSGRAVPAGTSGSPA